MKLTGVSRRSCADPYMSRYTSSHIQNGNTILVRVHDVRTFQTRRAQVFAKGKFFDVGGISLLVVFLCVSDGATFQHHVAEILNRWRLVGSFAAGRALFQKNILLKRRF
jgi:hypothetical protein